MNEFKVITICGSMRFYEGMLEAAGMLSRKGYIVLMPFVTFAPGDEQKSEPKEMLDRMHFVKIDMSDEVCLVTDTNEYIGESTRNELNYATRNNKHITKFCVR